MKASLHTRSRIRVALRGRMNPLCGTGNDLSCCLRERTRALNERVLGPASANASKRCLRGFFFCLKNGPNGPRPKRAWQGLAIFFKRSGDFVECRLIRLLAATQGSGKENNQETQGRERRSRQRNRLARPGGFSRFSFEIGRLREKNSGEFSGEKKEGKQSWAAPKRIKQ